MATLKAHVDLLTFNTVIICVFTTFYASSALVSNTNTPGTGLRFKLGNCPAAVFYAEEQNCMQGFFETVRANRMITPNCSARYSALRQCMIDAYEGCVKGSPSEQFFQDGENTALKNFLTFFGNQNRWCRKGGLTVPTYFYKGTVCHPIFQYVGRNCLHRYKTIFNSRTSSNKLCREHQQAKTCLFRNLVNHCNFYPRPLKQMIEEMVSAQFNYQPFCSRNRPSRVHSYDDLLKQQACPPQAHADVIFVIDVSSETSTGEFRSMKDTIATITRRLRLGRTGTRIGVTQFHERTITSIGLSRFATKTAFLRGLKRTRRIRTRRGSRRLVGKTLKVLAKKQFNLGDASTTIRYHHTPVVVLLTTGASDDNMLSAVNELNFKKVRLIRLGPSLRYGVALNDVTFQVNDTRNYSQHSDDILREICNADREYRSSDTSIGGSIQEYISESSRTSRLPSSHLLSLWIPTRIPRVTYSIPTRASIYSPEMFSSTFDNSPYVQDQNTDDPVFYIGEGV